MNAPFQPHLRLGVAGAEAIDYPIGPILWSGRASAWIVTRFADCAAVLADRRFAAYDLHAGVAAIATRARKPLPNLLAFLRASLIFASGDHHRRLRTLLSFTLGGLPIAAMAPRMREIADRLWQSGIAQGGFDAVRDFAESLPSLVIADVLGLGDRERRAFFDATYGLMGVYNRGSLLRQYVAFEDKLAVLRPVIDAVLAEDKGARFAAEADRLGFDTDETAAAFTFLYLAAVDQTSALIGLAVRTIAQRPDLHGRLAAGEAQRALFLEELLRFESPAPEAIRVATEPATIGEAAIAAGDTLVVLIAVANRDPARFTAPATFDPDRPRQRNLAFSEGAHACIGAAFARVEMRVALDTIVAGPPALLASTETEWWPLDASRRLRSLPLVFPR